MKRIKRAFRIFRPCLGGWGLTLRVHRGPHFGSTFLVLVFAGLAGVAKVVSQTPPSELSPLIFKRVNLSTDGAAEEMARTKAGTLIQLSASAFEEKLRNANQAVRAAQEVPLLTEARYRARLDNSALVGSAQWQILYSGSRPGLLSIDSLNLALHQPRFENGDAPLGETEGGALGLLVEPQGSRSLTFDWTARGETGPSGTRFKLELPSCAVSSLELNLPVDQAPAEEGGDCQISGPLPADSADRRLWILRFSDRPKLFLAIRRLEGPGQPAPLVLADLTTEQRLTPEAQAIDYRFNLVVLHQGVRTLKFRGDACLRPIKVSAPKLENWEVKPGTNPQNKLELVVRLHEPLLDGTVKISCQAPLECDSSPADRATAGIPWRSPGLELEDAIPNGETLKLFLHPEIRFDGWQSHGFRLVDSRSETASDRAWPHVLILKRFNTSSVAPEQGPIPATPDRPSAIIAGPEAEYRARCQLWWQIHPPQSRVTAQIGLEVIHGSLFHTSINLPNAAEVERVESTPPGIVRDWKVRLENGVKHLLVEFSQPVQSSLPILAGIPKATPRLLVIFRWRPQTGNIKDEAFGSSFPELMAPGAKRLESSLAIDWDEDAWTGKVDCEGYAAAEPDEGPWGKNKPTVYLDFADQPTHGRLALTKKLVRLTAQAKSEINLSRDHAFVKGEVRLQGESGLISIIDLVLSGDGANTRNWLISSEGLELDRTEPLSFPHHSAAVAITGSSLQGDSYATLFKRGMSRGRRVYFRSPLHPKEPALLHFSFDSPSPEKGRWLIPTVGVLQASRLTGELSFDGASSHQLKVKATNLTQVNSPEESANLEIKKEGVRQFRYADGNAFLEVTGVLSESESPRPLVTRSTLKTYIGSTALLRQFTFELANASQQSFTLLMPKEAQVLSIKVDGRWLDRLETPPVSPNTDPLALELPIPRTDPEATPSKSSMHVYSIVFEQPYSPGPLRSSIATETPHLPFSTKATEFSWLLPPGIKPWNQSHVVPITEGLNVSVLGFIWTWLAKQAGLQASLATGGRRMTGLEESVFPGLTPIKNRPFPMAGLMSPSDGTYWKCGPNWNAETPFIVIEEKPILLGGLFLALIVLWGWSRLKGIGTGYRVTMFVGILTALGLAWRVLPSVLTPLVFWPMAAGLLIGIGFVIGGLFRSKKPSASPSKIVSKLAATSILLTLAYVGSINLLAAPAENTDLPMVYVVPPAVGSSDRETILAPANWLASLDALSRKAQEGPQSAILVSAEYEGRIVSTSVDVTAQYRVFLNPKRGRLTIPLKGVQIQDEVFLDGARAFPTVEGKTGFSVKIEGTGWHTLQVKLRTALLTSGEMNELEFNAPRPSVSRLRLHLPATAQFPTALTRLGRQVITPGKDESLFEIDLGHTPAPIQVSYWLPDPKMPKPAIVAREAYLWTLRSGTSSLTGRLECSVRSGIVTHMEVDLPEPLEVRGIGVEPEGKAAGLLTPRLKSWNVVKSESHRILAIDFQTPISGSVNLVVDMAPRHALSGLASLPLPTLHGVETTPSVCAFRIDGVETQIKGLAHLTAIRINTFEGIWKALGGEDKIDLGGAYVINRRPEGSPFLNLNISEPAAPLACLQEITWLVNTSNASFNVRAKLTATEGKLVIGLFHVPDNVILDHVTGKAVWNWSRKDSTLQVWLQDSMGANEIEIAGRLLRKKETAGRNSSSPNAAAPAPQSPDLIFEMPAIYPLGTRSLTTTLRLRAGNPLTWVEGTTPQLMPLPTNRASDQERWFLTKQMDYSTRFILRPNRRPSSKLNSSSAISAKSSDSRSTSK